MEIISRTFFQRMTSTPLVISPSISCSANLAFCFSSPWQLTQCCFKNGTTFSVNTLRSVATTLFASAEAIVVEMQNVSRKRVKRTWEDRFWSLLQISGTLGSVNGIVLREIDKVIRESDVFANRCLPETGGYVTAEEWLAYSRLCCNLARWRSRRNQFDANSDQRNRDIGGIHLWFFRK